MYRHRNRPKYSDEELAELYKHPYNHERWPDHVARVEKTIEVGKQLYKTGDCIADLSCGDAAIAMGIDGFLHPEFGYISASCLQLGDFQLRLDLEEHCSISGFTGKTNAYRGPIEETIQQLDHEVDLFICSETIEHLDMPDDVLVQIRQKAKKLLLSTPNCRWPDPNPEHYHSWDDEAVKQMLTDVGWKIEIEASSYTGLGYNYQIYGCS